MKNFKASLAMGACLLFSSYGVAFATGQPGTTAGNNCGANGLVLGPSAGAIGTPNPINPQGSAGGSPFSADANNLTKGYAGNSTNPTSGGGHSGNAVSQYDVACLNATSRLTKQLH